MEEQDNIPLCKDCEFFSSPHFCDKKVAVRIDPVNGMRMEEGRKSCYDEREESPFLAFLNKCGPKGRFFEKRRGR